MTSPTELNDDAGLKLLADCCTNVGEREVTITCSPTPDSEGFYDAVLRNLYRRALEYNTESLFQVLPPDLETLQQWASRRLKADSGLTVTDDFPTPDIHSTSAGEASAGNATRSSKKRARSVDGDGEDELDDTQNLDKPPKRKSARLATQPFMKPKAATKKSAGKGRAADTLAGPSRGENSAPSKFVSDEDLIRGRETKPRGNRTEDERKQELEDDDWVKLFSLKYVVCDGCNVTIKCCGKGHYYDTNWSRHRKLCERIPLSERQSKRTPGPSRPKGQKKKHGSDSEAKASKCRPDAELAAASSAQPLAQSKKQKSSRGKGKERTRDNGDSNDAVSEVANGDEPQRPVTPPHPAFGLAPGSEEIVPAVNTSPVHSAAMNGGSSAPPQLPPRLRGSISSYAAISRPRSMDRFMDPIP
ncbi:hypothetical protein CONPUDRAFT_147602 [Coniophora puteana RWD-64-598 SS2]|uniref:Uncharacterized protein n=1 Tax=Coniophora puteana (strain RWD-64-598) TaxID=741705 RepID=R7SEE9_CONPW|nr:uncharacterized protein CONPUDRAFT_147602 [Coniophora puteana RWD-64-598 SS2]EIW74561.1 hypothetical protein CONPUDRAFT_147602 [Coniophora puteana RWD-64-598 SS2]